MIELAIAAYIFATIVKRLKVYRPRDAVILLKKRRGLSTQAQMLERLRQLYWAFTDQFGVRPRLFVSACAALPAFLSDLQKFRKTYRGSIQVLPFLHDKRQASGDSSSEYFLQDLSVAKRIFIRNPVKHVDVGSRVDGFVAHVAVFRSIEVLDIRPTEASIEGIEFTQADLMNSTHCPVDYCDSLSCLHALEHFGLGRYGDNVDPLGWQAGLTSLARILIKGGVLYLSVPVGKELVVFNAHRVFAPDSLVEFASKCDLSLRAFTWISAGRTVESQNIASDLAEVGRLPYSLGIFEFTKL